MSDSNHVSDDKICVTIQTVVNFHLPANENKDKEAYEDLLHNIDANSEKYAEEDGNWIKDRFNQKEYFRMSTVEVNEFTPDYEKGLKTDEQKSLDDLANAIQIHKAFKNLTPLQASNKNMWTYLCHCNDKCRKYIQDRWLNEARSNTIRTRFFVMGNTSLLNDNGLSRLWWCAHLTYDEGNSYHYALTEILLTNQTICTDFMDTANRMNFNRMKGVLLAIGDFKDLVGGNEGITEYFRACNKYLNRYGAVTNLDYLEPEEIRDLALNYMVSLRNQRTEAKRR